MNTQNNFSAYNFQASGSAGSAAKIKLEEHLHGKISTARQVLDRVESQLITDQVTKGSVLEFLPAHQLTNEFAAENKLQKTGLAVETASGLLGIHDHALMQIGSKADVPAIYTRRLLAGDEWRQDLLAHNLNEIYSRGNGTKYLLRSVDSQLRGFLSDKFKRMDSKPLLDSFCVAASELGAIPIEGFALDTKMRMRAVLPIVFEPITGEVFAFGVEFGTSDFGDGGLYLSVFLLRLTCLNGATMADVMRKIHLGSRLSEDITFSQATYELDTRANAAALKDAVKFALNPARLDAYMDVLQRADSQPVTDGQAQRIFKSKLTKDEAAAAFGAFQSPDVINLPAGKSVYRLSNAISWIAQFDGTSRSRELELQKIAGDVLPETAASTASLETLTQPVYSMAA